MQHPTFHKDQFRFGLETEYVVAERETFKPLWQDTLTFERLNGLMEKVDLSGIPSLDGLELEPPHRKPMPFVVEGYHLPDMDFKARELLPKGAEIRTPVCDSIEQCLSVQKTLFDRLQGSLASDNLSLVALSHHPIAHHFRGPQNKRRHDYWMWSMEVMTTYGPDINVGVPADLMKRLDIEDFNAKINHYAPAMTAFSVCAPFRDGKLWEIRGRIGKSLRTYRRSIIAPPIEVHPHENNRLEFKVFDMATDLRDYENFFLMFLALLLDDNLKGRASNATRIYDSGAVAIEGFHADTVSERAAQILESAHRVLPAYGFKTDALASFAARLDSKRTPADDLIELYLANGGDLAATLKSRSTLTGSIAQSEGLRLKSPELAAAEALA